MKKHLFLFLILGALLIVGAVLWFGGVFSAPPQPYERTVDMSDGQVYLSRNDERALSIAYAADGSALRCSFLFENERQTLYRFVFTEEQLASLSAQPATPAFWAEAESFARSHLEQAVKVGGFSVSQGGYDSTPRPGGSVGYHFFEELSALYGKRYTGRLLEEDIAYSDCIMQVYESVAYQTVQTASLYWRLKEPVFFDEFASILAFTSNASCPSPAVLGSTLGRDAVGIADTLTGNDTLRRYYCDILCDRFVTVENTHHVYASAQRRYRFEGYDAKSVLVPSMVDIDSLAVTYTPSASHFDQYQTKLLPEAYRAYQQEKE